MSMSKRTPLFEEHQRLGGKMVDFGGWELPVQYSGLSQEHQAVRTACGIFDVSHMGEIRVKGPGALEFVNFVTTNDASALSVYQAQYSAFCNDSGGIIDDLVVYRLADEEFFLVVNAANIDKDFSHLVRALSSFQGKKPSLTNESDDFAQIAIQGPFAAEILQKVSSINLNKISTYWCSEGMICGEKALIARTGYTGEDGFEIYLSKSD
jgi:aminomethyltransferase